MSEVRMQELPDYKPGTFCWVELGTSDGEAAKKFYTQLFGWDYVDHPMGPGMVYTMLTLDGKDVAALYTLMPDMVAQGIPPNWLSYVSVTNVDETAAKAKAPPFTTFPVVSSGMSSVQQTPTKPETFIQTCLVGPNKGSPAVQLNTQSSTMVTEGLAACTRSLLKWDRSRRTGSFTSQSRTATRQFKKQLSLVRAQ